MRRRTVLGALIVEDDRAILKQIKYFILNAFNREIRVLIAKTFKDAKEIIEKGMIDIFIFDFGLPDGHGEDLINLTRKLYPKAPIIVQTTIADKDYKIKIYKKFKGISYIEKSVLFEELGDAVSVAQEEALGYQSKRLSLISREKIDSVELDSICSISAVQGTKNLNIDYYDHNKGDYDFKIMRNTTLSEFMKNYNESGYFLRCHGSYIINKKMVKEVNRIGSYVVFIYNRSNNKEVFIPISEHFKKDVLDSLKGFY